MSECLIGCAHTQFVGLTNVRRGREKKISRSPSQDQVFLQFLVFLFPDAAVLVRCFSLLVHHHYHTGSELFSNQSS